MKENKELGGHQEGDREVNDHGMRMPSGHGALDQKSLEKNGQVIQLLRRPLLQKPHLGIAFQDFRSMRGGRDLAA